MIVGHAYLVDTHVRLGQLINSVADGTSFSKEVQMKRTLHSVLIKVTSVTPWSSVNNSLRIFILSLYVLRRGTPEAKFLQKRKTVFVCSSTNFLYELLSMYAIVIIKATESNEHVLLIKYRFLFIRRGVFKLPFSNKLSYLDLMFRSHKTRSISGVGCIYFEGLLLDFKLFFLRTPCMSLLAILLVLFSCMIWELANVSINAISSLPSEIEDELKLSNNFFAIFMFASDLIFVALFLEVVHIFWFLLFPFNVKLVIGSSPLPRQFSISSSDDKKGSLDTQSFSSDDIEVVGLLSIALFLS